MTEQTRIFGKRILLVEDDPSARQSLNLLLKIDRHEVMEATNGKEALDLFTQQRFDLVIVDYLMPEMQGSELALTIKCACPSQPILMVTAYYEKLAGSAMPVDAVLSKPFAVHELRETIAALLC